MSLSSYREQEAEAQKSADAQEKFNEAIDGVLPLMTRLTIELQKLGQNELMINSIIDGLVWNRNGAGIMKYLANPMGLIITLAGALILKFGAAALAGVAYGKGMAFAGAGMKGAGMGGNMGAPGISALVLLWLLLRPLGFLLLAWF